MKQENAHATRQLTLVAMGKMEGTRVSWKRPRATIGLRVSLPELVRRYAVLYVVCFLENGGLLNCKVEGGCCVL